MLVEAQRECEREREREQKKKEIKREKERQMERAPIPPNNARIKPTVLQHLYLLNKHF